MNGRNRLSPHPKSDERRCEWRCRSWNGTSRRCPSQLQNSIGIRQPFHSWCWYYSRTTWACLHRHLQYYCRTVYYSVRRTHLQGKPSCDLSQMSRFSRSDVTGRAQRRSHDVEFSTGRPTDRRCISSEIYLHGPWEMADLPPWKAPGASNFTSNDKRCTLSLLLTLHLYIVLIFFFHFCPKAAVVHLCCEENLHSEDSLTERPGSSRPPTKTSRATWLIPALRLARLLFGGSTAGMENGEPASPAGAAALLRLAGEHPSPSAIFISLYLSPALHHQWCWGSW